MKLSEIQLLLDGTMENYGCQHREWIDLLLSTGPEAVAIAQLDGTIIAQWPTDQTQGQTLHGDNATAVEPLFVTGRQIGTLCVYGNTQPCVRIQLAASAKLLSMILAMESETSAMTEDIIEHQDRIMALHMMAQRAQHQNSLHRSMQGLAQIATRSHHTENGFLVLQYPDGSVLSVDYPRNSARKELWPRLVNQLPNVQQDGQWHLTSKDEIIQQLDPNLKNALIRKLMVTQDTALYMGVANKQAATFKSGDIKLFDTITGASVVTLRNSLLHAESLQKERIQTEMDLAKKVQMSLLPKQTPRYPEIEIAARSLAASEVGGDFYDFSHNGDLLSLSLGDVSGKGMGAALFMAMLRTVLRGKAAEQTCDAAPGEILEQANAQLYEDFSEIGMFATVFQGQYNVKNNTFHFANDGHAPVIYRPHGGKARMLVADNPPLGILPDHSQAFQSLLIRSGDVFLIASDGITEAEQENGDMFGYDRLLELIDEHAHLSANQLLETIFKTVCEFSGEKVQSDDQTIMVLKRKNNSGN